MTNKIKLKDSNKIQKTINEFEKNIYCSDGTNLGDRFPVYCIKYDDTDFESYFRGLPLFEIAKEYNITDIIFLLKEDTACKETTYTPIYTQLTKKYFNSDSIRVSEVSPSTLGFFPDQHENYLSWEPELLIHTFMFGNPDMKLNLDIVNPETLLFSINDNEPNANSCFNRRFLIVVEKDFPGVTPNLAQKLRKAIINTQQTIMKNTIIRDTTNSFIISELVKYYQNKKDISTDSIFNDVEAVKKMFDDNKLEDFFRDKFPVDSTSVEHIDTLPVYNLSNLYHELNTPKERYCCKDISLVKTPKGVTLEDWVDDDDYDSLIEKSYINTNFPQDYFNDYTGDYINDIFPSILEVFTDYKNKVMVAKNFAIDQGHGNWITWDEYLEINKELYDLNTLSAQISLETYKYEDLVKRQQKEKAYIVVQYGEQQDKMFFQLPDTFKSYEEYNHKTEEELARIKEAEENWNKHKKANSEMLAYALLNDMTEHSLCDEPVFMSMLPEDTNKKLRKKFPEMSYNYEYNPNDDDYILWPEARIKDDFEEECKKIYNEVIETL